MAVSPSTAELDRAISELDGMYKDLTSTLERNLQVEGQFAAVNSGTTNDAYDDEDYDIPRPASGYQNEMTRSNVSSLSNMTSPPDINTGSFNNHYMRSVSSQSWRSDTSTVQSESSSGFGTLTSQKVLEPPTGISFPGPPEFEPPPPIVVPPSDSDYDEVASDDSDSFEYRHPAKKPLSNSNSSDYAEVLDDENITVNVIKVNTMRLSMGDEIPDYDEVYSVPTSPRESTIMTSVNETIVANAERIPMVVEMKHVSPSPPPQVEMLDKKEESSFINPPLVEIIDSTDDKIGVEYADSVDDVTIQPLPDDGASIQPHVENSAGNKHSTGRRSNYTPAKTTMDAEAQNKRNRKKDDCPCECRYAVPLMSVAVVICIVAFMFLVIAFVYLGLQNEKYLESVNNGIGSSFGNSTNSGGGSGSGM